jgi:hypothetical protein
MCMHGMGGSSMLWVEAACCSLCSEVFICVAMQGGVALHGGVALRGGHGLLRCTMCGA